MLSKINMKKETRFLLAFLFFVTLAFSQTNEKGLSDEFAKADKELNTVYNQLKSKLEPEDKKALVNAQKAWLTFRDLNCKFVSKEDSEGGAIATKMKVDCLTQSTLERVKELKELLEEF